MAGTSFIQDLTSAIDCYNHQIIIGDFNADILTNKADFTFVTKVKLITNHSVW